MKSLHLQPLHPKPLHQSLHRSRRGLGAITIAVASIFAASCGSAPTTTAATAADATSEESTELPTLATTTPGSESGEQSATTPPEEAETDPELAMAEYEACMDDLGIDVPDFDGGGGVVVEEFEVDAESTDSVDFEEMQAAMDECDDVLEEAFGSFEMSPEQEAEMADQLLELERCLADAGFDIDMNEGGFELPADIEFEDFNEAMNNCQPDQATEMTDVVGGEAG